MFDALSALFDTSGFVPRWQCGSWSSVLGWTHIVADSVIAAAYFAIPVVIAWYVRRRGDMSFPSLYWIFAAFILSCGVGHLLESVIFWTPVYRLSAIVKILTAIASVVAVVALLRIVPQALAMPVILQKNDELRREVAERAAAEQEVLRLNKDLEQRVQELATLLDVIPVAIAIARDRDCKTIVGNAALSALLRIPAGSNASLGGPEATRPDHFRVMREGRQLAPEELPIQVSARTGATIRDFEEEVVHDDGTRHSVMAYAAPLRENGDIRGAVGAFIDVTAYKAAESERLTVERKLLDMQKLESLGVLAGGIAHDFNNLLTGVLGYAALARLELPEDSPITEYVGHIETSATRAAELCRQMLAYSGRGRFILENVDVNAMISDTSALLNLSISKRSSLHLDLDPALPRVLADMTQLRQVLMNLVINASEAIGEKAGAIRIATRVINADHSYVEAIDSVAEISPGDYVSIEVTDNGCGMTPEIIERIFDPFFTTKFTGRGLGLAAVLGIVRGHKGTLKVYSEPQIGTTFKLLFPVAAGDEVAHRPGKSKESSWSGSGHVLVIDDEPAARDVAGRALTRLGFRCDLAGNGVEGVAVFARDPSRYRFVVLDLTMPQWDGSQTFEQLRRIRADVPVILTSGFNESDALDRFADGDIAAFIQKPFDPRVFKEICRRILGEHEQSMDGHA